MVIIGLAQTRNPAIPEGAELLISYLPPTYLIFLETYTSMHVSQPSLQGTVPKALKH